MNQLKTIRIIAWLAIAALGIWLFVKPPISPNGAQEAPVPIMDVKEPFLMVNQKGKPVTEAFVTGKPSMIFFGFTHCPAICPGAMADMGIWLEKLGKDASRINPVFVSVDPERDDVKRLSSFLKSYDKRITGLTGTPEQVAAITKAYGIYYKKMPPMNSENGEGSDYMVDHSASIYLYDKNRRLISTIDTLENRDIAFAKIKKLIGENQ